MNNQHKQIKGYRDLTQQEIDLMSEGKPLQSNAANTQRKSKLRQIIDGC